MLPAALSMLEDGLNKDAVLLTLQWHWLDDSS
jgi:hypothetical protein